MLRRLAIILGMVVVPAVSPSGFAQSDYPRAELFGGFSYLPANGMDFPRRNSVGFQTSITGNLTRAFGIVADLGGQYNKTSDLGPGFPGTVAKSSVYEYMAGPRFAMRREKFTVFFQGLVGGARGHTDLGGFSDRQFAVGGGGGLDVALGRRIAIRVIQLDYVGSFVDILENNTRLGFGIVLKLGGF